jgi:hypothetical protein
MSRNLNNMKKNPKKVEAGDDNRADKLHSARFLGGHICENTEIWLKAREHIGISGLDPISRYDSEGVGMNGNLNGHIWAAIHNPGSKEISIRSFSPETLKTVRSSNEKDSASCKKDFAHINEIRMALATLRMAIHFVHPWNFSVATLDYFLNSTQFGEREFGVANERIQFVTNFIDEVLAHNAEAWDDAKPFMTAHEISTKWVAAVMLRGPKPSTSHQTQNRNRQNIGKKINALDRSIEVPKDVCRRYNAKNCPSQNDKTCKAPWDGTTDLKHACAFRLPDKSFCLKDHPLAEHK